MKWAFIGSSPWEEKSLDLPADASVTLREELGVSLLLDANANPNQARNSGATPLHIASQKGQVACVQTLLRA